MSDAESVAALALAVNIVDVIGFGLKSVKLMRRIYRTGTVDSSLNEYIRFMGDMSGQIAVQQPPASPSTDQKQLFRVAEMCQNTTECLQKETATLPSMGSRGNLLNTLKLFFNVLWRSRKLDTLEQKLREAQRTMQDGLLVRICNRLDGAPTNLDTMTDRLREFWSQYRQGYTDVLELVSREATISRSQITTKSINGNMDIKQHVASEIIDAERTTRMHIKEAGDESTTDLVETTDSFSRESDLEKKRSRLLRSLKFQGMYERRSQAHEAYEHTFRWVFDGHHPDPSVEGMSNSSTSNDPHEDLSPFTRWLRSPEKIFWIQGKPGSGKTTLMKYLLSDPKTKKNLAHWNVDHTIISHFFWLPGHSLQKNIKGMFCSILCQLLQSDTKLIDNILAEVDVGIKRNETDWSDIQLSAVCLKTIGQCEKALCIFLDGLDEVDPKDGLRKLLEIIDLLQASDRVKICLSSRPEPVIRVRLEKYSKLQLQDLTVDDMFSYAYSHVHFPHGGVILSIDEKQDLLEELVRKANGVFLWLYLAVEKINKDLQYDNNLSDLRKRIENLPTDLTEMYAVMWNRMRDDEKAYRQNAALYFKLAIFYQNVLAPKPWWRLRKAGGIPALDMILISTGMSRQLLEQHRAIPPAQHLLDLFKQTIQLVQTRCSGLLEISYDMNCGTTSSPDTPKLVPSDKSDDISTRNRSFAWDGGAYDDLVRFTAADLHFRFIHRSALDFLLHTSEGKAILDHYPTSYEHLLVRSVEAQIATSRLFFIREHGHKVDTENGNIWTTTENILRSVSDCEPPEWSTEAYKKLELERFAPVSDRSHNLDDHLSLEYEQQRLILSCEALFASGRLRSSNRKHPYGHATDFVVIASAHRLYDFALNQARQTPMTVMLKSEILLNASRDHGVFRGRQLERYSVITTWLLENGADPNWRGVWLPDMNGAFPNLLQTPFTSFLVQMLEICRFREQYSTTSTLFFLLSQFMTHGARVDEEVYLTLPILYAKVHGDDGNIPCFSLFSAIAVGARGQAPGFAVVAVPASKVIEAIISRLRHVRSGFFDSREGKSEVASLLGHCKHVTVKARFVAFFVAESNTGHQPFPQIPDEVAEDLAGAFVLLLFQPWSQENWRAFLQNFVKLYPTGVMSKEGVCDYLEQEGILAPRRL